MHQQSTVCVSDDKGLRTGLAHHDEQEKNLALRETALEDLEQRSCLCDLRRGVDGADEEQARCRILEEPRDSPVVFQCAFLSGKVLMPDTMVCPTIRLPTGRLAPWEVFHGEELHEICEPCLEEVDHSLNGRTVPVKWVRRVPQLQVTEA